MAHIIINPSLSAAIGYNIFLNPPKYAVVIAILEPANSTRTDNSMFNASNFRYIIFFGPCIVLNVSTCIKHATHKCNRLNEFQQYKTTCLELTFTRPML